MRRNCRVVSSIASLAIKRAEAFLRFDRFVLGVGGVSTFKSSHLREDLPAAVPLDRIVLETDSPYMAPVPYRGNATRVLHR